MICFDAASESRLGDAGRPAATAPARRWCSTTTPPTRLRRGASWSTRPPRPPRSWPSELLDRLGVPLDAQIADVPLRGAGHRHRLVQVRRDHAGGAPSWPPGCSPPASAPGDISRRVFDTRPFGAVRLFGEVLGRAQLEPAAAGGRGLVWTYATLDDLARHDQRPYVLEALIDSVRCTAEADVAAWSSRSGRASGRCRCAARARSTSAAVAVALGGGGSPVRRRLHRPGRRRRRSSPRSGRSCRRVDRRSNRSTGVSVFPHRVSPGRIGRWSSRTRSPWTSPGPGTGRWSPCRCWPASPWSVGSSRRSPPRPTSGRWAPAAR